MWSVKCDIGHRKLGRVENLRQSIYNYTFHSPFFVTASEIAADILRSSLTHIGVYILRSTT